MARIEALASTKQFLWRQVSTRLRWALREDLDRVRVQATDAAYSQAEHYVQLVRRLPNLDVTGLRGFALSPDVLVELVDLIERERPNLVVELGSGMSTVVLVTAMNAWVPDGRVVSIDHDEGWAHATRNLLAARRLDADVRTAPLLPYGSTSDSNRLWYDTAAVEDLFDIELLLIDGPPGFLGPSIRAPSLKELLPRMARPSHVVLDDTLRKDERVLAENWSSITGASFWPIAAEKGAAIVQLRAPS